MDQGNDLLLASSGDESTLSLALSNSEYVVGEFLKGMEVANRLLPRDNSFVKDHQMSQIFIRSKRKHMEEELGRTSKILMMTEVPEETGIHEVLDNMMMAGHDTLVRDMEKLRIAMDNKEEKKSRKGCSKVMTTGDMVDLSTLLICCAQAVDTNNYLVAGELLNQIKQHASTTGDATQRVALCFTKGLEARLVGAGSQLWQVLMAERPSIVEFLKAYRLYFAACSFNKVALSFSTMTILQAMVGKSKLHVVD